MRYVDNFSNSVHNALISPNFSAFALVINELRIARLFLILHEKYYINLLRITGSSILCNSKFLIKTEKICSTASTV
jgi:hypothetical protein